VAETPVSLLDRLQDRPAPADWRRLVDLYTPLLRDWLSRYPALRQEIDDLVQEILRCVVAKIPDFRRRRTGSFRRWLQVITANCINLYWRRQRGRTPAAGGDEADQFLAQLVDPDSPLDRSIDAEHDRYVVRRLLQLIEAEFRPETWRAFQRHVIDGLPSAAVARELGVSENAVLIARSRILKRLREEARGFID
jgi:RNA polymerase sigma-70 factor, ECF subfamily